MVESQVVSITAANHADAHRHGGDDPLTGDVRIDNLNRFDVVTTGIATALETSYQNTENHTVMILFTLPSISSAAHFELLCDAANPPTTQMHKTNGGVGEHLHMICMVPKDFYYRIHRTAGTGSVTIRRSIWV